MSISHFDPERKSLWPRGLIPPFGVLNLPCYDAMCLFWGMTMRRRCRAGGEPVKKRAHIKRRNAFKTVRGRVTSAAGQDAKVKHLARDLHEALEHQTATSEVLRIISSSPGDLNAAFQAILANATKLCQASYGTLWLCEGDAFRVAAQHGELHAAYMERLRPGTLFRLGPHLPSVQAINTRRPVQVSDLRLAQSYIDREPLAVAAVELAGIYTMFTVPMFRNYEPVGVIAIYGREPRPFTDKHIGLVEDFAAQAVIAIENTRLLNELRQRTDDLTGSLENLRITQNRLVQTEKLASLGQLTAGIAHEIKNPLNFVNNFSMLSAELIDELSDVLEPVVLDDRAREEIDELTQMLKGNLERVVQHGKRADSIVKNMLLHSREGAGEHQPTDINTLVGESLNLAYHGARAEKSGFNITLQRDLDPAAGMIDLYPQEITRVFLNLISNGFYAVTKRKESGGESFEPTLSATTKSLSNKVEIRIRDNGTGIPLDVKEKMFNPFFTTKPAGEGTGLGLSMSHDIIVKLHGGTIDVETEPGLFTEFKIVLPRSQK
jgi:signal transduction histidine kinase